MTCFLCKGDMVDGTTTYVEETDNCIVVIKNVPCQKCSQCGEVFFSGTVALRLEKIVDSFKTAMTEVAVVVYTAA